MHCLFQETTNTQYANCDYNRQRNSTAEINLVQSETLPSLNTSFTSSIKHKSGYISALDCG